MRVSHWPDAKRMDREDAGFALGKLSNAGEVHIADPGQQYGGGGTSVSEES
jgi:hypothetical protein